MSAPREVLAQLLSASQASVLDDTGKRAWAAAAGALRTILGSAPGVMGVDGRLVMPDELAGEFADPHLVVPLELSTSHDQAATAYLVLPTTATAAAVNSEAEDAGEQEQQTVVVASTMLGQVVQALNLQVFSASPAGLVVALDDIVANSMPMLLETMDEPALYLTFVASLGDPLPISFVLGGTFLDIVANSMPADDAPSATPTAAPEPLSFSLTADDLNMADLIEDEAPEPIRPPFQMPRQQPPVPPPPQARRQEPPPPVAQRARFAPIPDDAPAPARTGIDLLAGLQMNVSVELGRTELTVAEILGLGPGSVIELDRVAGEPVDILVNDRLIARGEVVVVDENFGVRVVEVVRRSAEQEEVIG